MTFEEGVLSVKVAIMTDSNSGISQSEAKQLGIYVIPMPFTINGVEYLEDINLTNDMFYEKLEVGCEVLTSQPTIGTLEQYWNRALEDYDAVVHIPMSSGLSGSCQTAMMLAEDEYPGKVFVVDDQRISITQRSDVLDALALAKAGKTASEIVDILMANKMEATIYITLETLEYLKRGGRITPAAAALSGLLKIRPVLSIQGGKLDKFDTARTMKKAKKIMIDAVKADIANRHFGEYKLYAVISNNDPELLDDFKKEVEEEFAGHPVETATLSLSVGCHIGPGALALGACKKII